MNDSLMDAAQKLICKAIGDIDSYQSVLNSQKRKVPYYPTGNEHLQLLHDGVNHWLLSCNSNDRVKVCDSLRTNLGNVTKRCLKALYKPLLDDNGKLHVTMLPVEKQSDGFNCGVYAIAYAADILHGVSPMESQYDVDQMRAHFIDCLENEQLLVFPKTSKRRHVEFDGAMRVITI